ncbi:MAG: hypothetical protein ACJ8F7_11400 [Gemmataceae bacterium]
MKADQNGPDGIAARVLGPAGADRLVVLLYPDIAQYGGGVRDDSLPTAIVPAGCRGEGSYLLLTPEGKGADRRFVSAILLPRYELRVEVPGPFPSLNGNDFVRSVVDPLEEALGRRGLGNYVHPWSFPDPDDDDWDCCYSVTDVREANTVTRAALAGLDLPAESVIVVWCPDEEPVRSYPLAAQDAAADWADLPQVERRAQYSVEAAVRRESPCW